MNIPTKDRLHTLEDGFYYEVYPCMYDAGMYTWALYKDTPNGHVCVHCSTHTPIPNTDANDYWEEHKSALLAR